MAKGTVNKVILLGRLGNDPEVRNTQSGITVATFSLATNDGIGDNITTEWHKIVIFGKAAETIQKYATKGKQIFVEGRLRTNKWQDQQGNNRYSIEIVASNFQLVGSSNSQGDLDNNNKFQKNTLHDNDSNQTKQDNMPDFDEINSSTFDDNIPF